MGVRRLAVVGGGRWGRVIAGVLLDITAPPLRITVHARHSVVDLRRWVSAHGAGRVNIHEAPLAVEGADRADVVIVANAAGAHEGVATRALEAGLPTLVEKPLTTSEAGARALVALAQRRKAVLAVSRVFVFARYVEAFVRAAAAADVTRARLVWTDPVDETRDGEIKRYDAGIPITSDLLPHALPLLGALCRAPAQLVDLTLDRGGMRTELRSARSWRHGARRSALRRCVRSARDESP